MLEHGGRLRLAAQEYGIPLAEWLDLSTGISPWPWSLPSVPASAWMRLPEDSDGLESAARRYYGAEKLLPLPGSQAAIQLLPRMRRPGKVGVVSPCYAEHAEAWRAAGHILREVSENEVAQHLERFDVLVVVNPNNPTGRRIEPGVLLEWHTRLLERGGWLVVDEAFMDCTPEQSLVTRCASRPGLVVLRSFGKFFGLAGARLGFAFAEPRLLAALAQLVGPWAVSGPTRWVAQAVLGDQDAQIQRRRDLSGASRRLAGLLGEYGFAPQGGTALFQWVVSMRSQALRDHLARQGILVRLFETPASLRFGLPPDEAGWQRLERGLFTFNQMENLR
ncbi:threonine-phosphate decarboxylase CobD [Pseudomonas sp. ZM23]|uniref:threonine-phosphate decarboxylase n=1 Tax=Pseudomonas triclosanedens TaxID=2961893 RepID=A0ABY7A2K2_9PSED|nr:threonine-phosphate decarboxylase CobD [Pseudomonas triclosanedens]MCP8464269.1 threonine-phosphate decarboxylase CobD [Pseudomonas triclosanedens]MCP8471403.1 threonine-phosphate decarboxylase CobD [Pseudomonas triclosanedens]MCP8477788.1 threonine-phosphate decarboxylase CobD [Pseudomonas triclosanedens]WAI51241.1 threonine-phosphate decarboxylase CobD [Pseudomonas triclosanedens]